PPLAGAIPTRSKRRKPEILLLYRGLAAFQATLIVDILPALKGGEDVNNSRPHHDVILTDRCQKQRIHPILYLPYNT
ncbi:TPA: hypothetical protein MHW53_28510, partial [Klebsiella pneumoniae]|nr:hypothetical protein [Klebsiella pneumoniae]